MFFKNATTLQEVIKLSSNPAVQWMPRGVAQHGLQAPNTSKTLGPGYHYSSIVNSINEYKLTAAAICPKQMDIPLNY